MSVYFDAIKTRFDTDKEIAKSCRKVYEGFDGEEPHKILPHLTIVVIDRPDMGTFTSDIEDATIELRLFSKDFRTKDSDKMIRDVIRVFDNAPLNTATISCHAMLRQSLTGPIMEDGLYRATFTYRVVATYASKSPVSRAV